MRRRRPKLRFPSASIYVALEFVEGEADGFVKVGVSSNVHRRMADLEKGSPRSVELSFVSPPMPRRLAFRVEKRVHGLLKSWRVRGEWYRCTCALAISMLNVCGVDVAADHPWPEA